MTRRCRPFQNHVFPSWVMINKRSLQQSEVFCNFFTIHQPLGCPRELGSMVRISGLYPQYIYIYTPFISRWNHPLILTTDPNFQRDIQPSYLSDSLTCLEFAASPKKLPRGDINVTTFDHQKKILKKIPPFFGTEVFLHRENSFFQFGKVVVVVVVFKKECVEPLGGKRCLWVQKNTFHTNKLV